MLRVRDALRLGVVAGDAGVRAGVAGRRRPAAQRPLSRAVAVRAPAVRAPASRRRLRSGLPGVDEALGGDAEPCRDGESDEELVPIHAEALLE